MKLAVDASTLIAELMRERGRRLFSRADLQLMVSEHAWVETSRGLERRATALRERMEAAAVDDLVDLALSTVRTCFIIVPADLYATHETVARSRVRDADDWPTVALALATDSAILTSDPDFLGSGVPTWTYETLFAELERR
ncbi:MAG: PIN domain-containing protein [Gemmatimonadota bacterium]